MSHRDECRESFRLGWALSGAPMSGCDALFDWIDSGAPISSDRIKPKSWIGVLSEYDDSPRALLPSEVLRRAEGRPAERAGVPAIEATDYDNL